MERRAVILIDEHAGRITATSLGLKTLGLLGVLLQAKMAGMLSLVAPLLDQLHKDARFWISPSLREKVLQLAGE